MSVKIILLIFMCFLVSAEITQEEEEEEMAATTFAAPTTTKLSTTTESGNKTKKVKVKKWRKKRKFQSMGSTERNKFQLITKKRQSSTQTGSTKWTRSTTIHPYFKTRTPFYFFEGVDYEFTNPELKKEHTDCYGEFMRCMRSRVTFEPVCAIDKYRYWYNEDFDNICQLELYNCNYRVKHYEQKPEGVDYISSNRYYYIGDWLYCNPDSLKDLTDEQREELQRELQGLDKNNKLKTVKTTTRRTIATLAKKRDKKNKE